MAKVSFLLARVEAKTSFIVGEAASLLPTSLYILLYALIHTYIIKLYTVYTVYIGEMELFTVCSILDIVVFLSYQQNSSAVAEVHHIRVHTFLGNGHLKMKGCTYVFELCMHHLAPCKSDLSMRVLDIPAPSLEAALQFCPSESSTAHLCLLGLH